MLHHKDAKRLDEILNANLDNLSKREIHAMRNELIEMMKEWDLAETFELRLIGVYGKFQAMLDKKAEMLAALKK